ncbi:MAG TPA: DNA gyrase modulator, partial [Candidatus Bathyarchaeia archaeon]|nr:DNA gyrase modulator [Candidatus Bathyarchaeia archaeon]
MGSQTDDLMEKAVKHAMRIGANFAETKGEDTTTGQIEAVDNEIRKVSEVRNIGIGVRVFYGKGNGFSFSNILDEENVLQAVETAMKIAKAATKKTLVSMKLAEVKAVNDKKTTSVNKHPSEVSIDEKKDLCLRQCQTAMGYNKQIANTNSMFGEYYGTVSYINSEGTRVSYEPLLIGLTITCVAKK